MMGRRNPVRRLWHRWNKKCRNPAFVIHSCNSLRLQVLFSSSLTMTGVISLYEAEKQEAWLAEQRVR